MRGIGHGLHSACNHYLHRTRLDEVMREHDRFHTGAADFVQRGGTRGQRQPAASVACRAGA